MRPIPPEPFQIGGERQALVSSLPETAHVSFGRGNTPVFDNSPEQQSVLELIGAFPLGRDGSPAKGSQAEAIQGESSCMLFGRV